MTTSGVPAAPLPLDGMRVLDIGGEVAGPFCARLLARLGADVIRIEPPGGDRARRRGRSREPRRGQAASALHLFLNEGKRGIVLDLAQPSGRDLFLRLVEQSAAVVEDFEPRVLGEMDLDYGTLHAANPRIVLTSVSGFGHSGPYRDFAASALTVFSMGGHMYRSGIRGRPPVRMGGHPAEVMAALHTAYGTLLAERTARLTGSGQHVTVSMLEAQVTSHAQAMVEVSYYRAETAADVPRGSAGIRGVLATDGLAMVSAQEQQLPALVDLVGAPSELANVSPMERGGARREIYRHIDEWAAQRTKREVYEVAQAARVPASYVASPADLLASPQYGARGFLQEIKVAGASVALPGLPFHWDGSDAPLRPAPALGEHNIEVYETLLGLTRLDICRLAAAGVIA